MQGRFCGGGACVEPGQAGDVELYEGEYWDVGLCTGVVIGVVLAMVVVTTTVPKKLVKVDCVRMVSESSSGGFVMVVVLEDFGLVL